ncbi:hypothetical protein HMPREF1624_04791 [Sporothrix schenckii ATCC 58251]|uniref:Major facilitator superfamily (MFS) profile domain-containing protein n=1 Tax=Sporothrix schenckii (strain ATCC 58251 / de Perez 2211183) TaxID=1391915 RepID=U7PXC7_SPOS1|nr:hypothetical protein HMPREF1624_04791 [Sporothrix schenckii ATCC 58251]
MIDDAEKNRSKSNVRATASRVLSNSDVGVGIGSDYVRGGHDRISASSSTVAYFSEKEIRVIGYAATVTSTHGPAANADVEPCARTLTNFVASSIEAPGSTEGGPVAQPPAETFPEGGLEAWLVVLGAWLALFSSLGILNSLATFQTYVSTHQLMEQSQSTIGWIFSLNAFMCFFAGVYIGPVFDKYGPRWLVLAGTMCLVGSLVLLSFCTELWHFILVFGLMNGLALALLFTPSIAAIGHFFSARRGFATGIASTGGGLGGVCIPLMLQSLFDRVGWAWGIRTLALVSLILSGLSNILLRSRLAPALDASTHPDVRIFRNVPFALTTLGVFLLEFALFVPLTYISTYTLSRGFSASFASQVVTILNAGSVVGRVLPGWYADKIGPFNANIIAVILAIVSCLVIWLPTSMLDSTLVSSSGGDDRNSAAAAPVVLFALLFGFTSGSNISLIPVSIGRLCATTNYGRYYATCYTAVSVATLVGIPIAGKILIIDGGEYWGLIVFTAALYVGSLVALFAAKASNIGWSLLGKF